MSRYICLILFILLNHLSLCAPDHKAFKHSSKSESVCNNMMSKSVTVKSFQHDIMLLNRWKMKKKLMIICQKIANNNQYPIPQRRLSILTICSQAFTLGSKFDSRKAIFIHNDWFNRGDINLYGPETGPDLVPIDTFYVDRSFVLYILPNKHKYSRCSVWIRLSRKISLDNISNVFNGGTISLKPVRIIRQIVIVNGYNKSDPWAD